MCCSSGAELSLMKHYDALELSAATSADRLDAILKLIGLGCEQ